MQKFGPGSFLGKNTNLLLTDNFQITQVFYPENLTSEWHYHENAYFALIQKGGSLERRKKGNIQCYPGLLLFYNDQEAHKNEKYLKGSKNICLELQNQWFKTHSLDKNFMEGAFKIENKSLTFLFYKIMNEVRINDNSSPVSIDGLLLQVYAEMIRNQRDMRPLPTWLQRVRDLLNDNWNKKITIAQVAKHVNVHPVTLSKEFSKYFGCTFGEYTRKLRIERSLQLLKKTNIPLDEVAVNYAFYDASHYINIFRSVYGMTPTTWRKLNSS